MHETVIGGTSPRLTSKGVERAVGLLVNLTTLFIDGFGFEDDLDAL